MYTLDSIFNALADPVRRDILERVGHGEYSISELASCYDVSFAAISKQLMVLEDAGLIHKRKNGRKRMVSLNHEALAGANDYLRRYSYNEGVY